MHLGVDVGGTNTDAVVLGPGQRLLARAKVPTTPDVREGIAAAIAQVLAAGVERERVGRAMLGTTQLANAILQRQGLHRVAVIRVGAPATAAVPPLRTWPPDLREAVSAGEAIVGGGAQLDGSAQAPLDRDAVARFAAAAAGRLDAIAITSIFSPVSAEHEHAAAEIAVREAGAVPISLSHEIGSLGLLERENATVLNAALGGVAHDVAHDVARAFEGALADDGLTADAFLTQNDGALMALEYALRLPVLTIGSGPANSMRGAAHLSGLADGLIADVGGTSTDVGVLVNGFPRESGLPARVGGVQTNFRMPDILSIPVGGGSRVRSAGGAARVGPASVGARLTREALVFGGRTATLTDAAVAGGRVAVGTRPLTAAQRRRLGPALAEADRLLAAAVDRMKPGPEPCPLVVVGGGSELLPAALEGVRVAGRPPHFDVANAIGAAIAPVSGHADFVCPNRPDRRRAALDQARAAAVERAIEAGAHPDTVEVVEVEEIPLTYLLDPSVRIRIKAIGRLV